MNRSASSTQKPRRKPRIVAKFDRSDERQDGLHRAMQRLHAGASPLWRMLAIRQHGHLIYEVAEQLPRRGKRPRYCVVVWNSVDCGVSWQLQSSRRSAFAALAGTPA